MLRALTVALGGLWALGQPPRAVPLAGNATLGYYFATALVGSTRQPQALIVDTGSHVTIFGCGECVQCNRHVEERFNASQSRSFRSLSDGDEWLGWRCEHASDGSCPFVQTYAEGSSYSGRYAQDQFVFENETRREAPDFTHVFGCAASETQQFFGQQANGILGLAVRPPYATTPPTIVEAEHRQKRSPNAQFSVCIGHEGGRLRFGTLNAELHLPGERERVIRPQKDSWYIFYAVPLTGVAVDRTQLHWDFARVAQARDQAFFDTGSTLTYLPWELHELWAAAFEAFCAGTAERCGGSDAYRTCFALDGRDREAFLRSFPDLTFTFGDVDYIWFAQDYMIEGGKEMCVGVQPLTDVVFGANFMRNYDITFDQSTQTVGFVRADCSSAGGVWPTAQARALPVRTAALPARTAALSARTAALPALGLLLWTLL